MPCDHHVTTANPILRRPYPLYLPGPAFVTAAVLSILMFSYVDGTNQYPKFVVTALCAVFGFHIIVSRRKLYVPAEYRVVGTWVLFCALSAFAALDPNLAFDKLMTLVTVIPMSFVLMHFVLWYRAPRSIWAGVIIGALLMCYLAARAGPIEPTDERLTATAGNANTLGYVLVVACVLLVHAMFSVRSLVLKAGTVVLAAVIVYVIPLTGSKQALISLFIAAAAYMALKIDFKSARQVVRSFAVITMFLCALTAALFYFERTAYFDRLLDFRDAAIAGKLDESGRTGESTKNRYLFYVNGIDMAAHNPAVGVGLDNFRLAITEYPGFRGLRMGAYAHSNYIEVLADTGFIGFMLYFAMYVVLARRLLRLRKMALRGPDRQFYHVLTVLFCVILVSDLAMVSYYDKIAWIVLSSTIGGAFLLERRLRAAAENETDPRPAVH